MSHHHGGGCDWHELPSVTKANGTCPPGRVMGRLSVVVWSDKCMHSPMKVISIHWHVLALKLPQLSK